jgi:hypothetical protein
LFHRPAIAAPTRFRGNYERGSFALLTADLRLISNQVITPGSTGVLAYRKRIDRSYRSPAQLKWDQPFYSRKTVTTPKPNA